MRKKRQSNEKINKEELELVNGYYMPKQIIPAFLQLRQYCIDETIIEMRQICQSVDCIQENDQFIVRGLKSNGALIRVIMTPQNVSHIEKLIGTSKFIEFIEEQSHG